MRRPRSRQPVPPKHRARPLYVRALRLQYINPNGTLCFLFVEGTVGLAILLALAEQVSWWAILVLPLSVAAMVKINDMVAGALVHSGGAAPPLVGRARVASASSGTMPQRAPEPRRRAAR